MKKISLLNVMVVVVLTFFAFDSAVFAQPTAASTSNNTHTYGYIYSNSHYPEFQDGWFYVAVPGALVRFDYEDSENNGASTLTPGLWVVVEGYVTTFFACFDNGSNMMRADTIYRWVPSTNSWQVWNKSSSSWVAW